MKKLGVKTYRFSVAWTRIVPSGLAGSPVNPKGVQWYKVRAAPRRRAGASPARPPVASARSRLPPLATSDAAAASRPTLSTTIP